MKNTDEHIESLILKQIRQEASAAEQAELQSWLDADPANQAEYEALANLWEASLPVLQPHTFDRSVAWDKMRARIRPVEEPAVVAGAPKQESAVPGETRPVRPFNARRWMAAAAVLLLLAGAGWWYYRASSGGVRTESIVARDGNRRIDLPDGSVAFLRKGGALTYPARFSGHQRLVELEGEAYFEVGHDAASPFVVRTDRSVVEELGTSFVVRQAGPVDEVSVITGMVKCTERAESARSIVLAAGEKAMLTENGFIKNSQSDANILSWKTNILEFNGTPLDQVVADVQDLYGIHIALSPDLRPRAGEIRITARFAHTEQAKEVLEEIKLMSGLAIKQEKDTLVFFRK
ncbi:FecR family protein [Puia dinghuensis]|uniref:DUF4974 domain-containing protein n=1 Tax=Puia dinghuensis TaxID=1792502 RepID=A0A8J2UDG0_9BACT|nr:FecR domain-containing protein [Puia dinghuensis]GGB00881.1 hypothetical protein GCM10011511_25220 [Puia dinghuensis]